MKEDAPRCSKASYTAPGTLLIFKHQIKPVAEKLNYDREMDSFKNSALSESLAKAKESNKKQLAPHTRADCFCSTGFTIRFTFITNV